MSHNDSLSRITSVGEDAILVYGVLANQQKVDLQNIAKEGIRIRKDDEAPLQLPAARSPSPPLHRGSPSRVSRASTRSSRSRRSRRSSRGRARRHSPYSRNSRNSRNSRHSRRSRGSGRSPSPHFDERELRISQPPSIRSVGSPPSFTPSLASGRSRRRRHSPSPSRSRSSSSYRSHRYSSSRSRSPASYRSREVRSYRHRIAEDVFGKGFSEEDPDVIREKQQYIDDLENRRQQDPTLNIPHFTTRDRLADIEQVYNRFYFNENERDMVELFKEGLKGACSGIEWANKTFGPFLKLDKWSDVVARDVNDKKRGRKYDNALREIYRRYFSGRGSMNPLAQLGFVIAASMGNHHFKKAANPDWDPLASSRPVQPAAPPPVTPYNFPPNQFAGQGAAPARPTFPRPPQAFGVGAPA